MERKTYIGQRFGRWTVLGEAPKLAGSGHRRVWVKCDCGTKRTVELRRVTSGQTKSCGCGMLIHGENRRTPKEQANNRRPKRDKLELKHVANHRPPHGLPLTLDNPTDEEVEETKRELDECPDCQRHGRPDIYIRSYYVPQALRRA